MSFKFYFRILFCLFLISFVESTYAQHNYGGSPFSFYNDSIYNLMQASLTTITLPALDNASEKRRAQSIATAKCRDCGNTYYGRGIDVNIDIKNQGQLEVLRDGSKLWLLKIESATAYGMQFYFDKFKLPEGAELYIFNENKKMLLGAFTSGNNPNDQSQVIKFGTQHIEGKSIFLEYHEPNSPKFEGELSITKVIHIFEFGGPFGDSEDCHENAKCLSNSWNDQISSVNLILKYENGTQLAAVCTGVLINTVEENGNPYILTAQHCLDSDPPFGENTWTFLFNHETYTCYGDGSDISAFGGESLFGASSVSEDSPGLLTTDFALLVLTNPDAKNILASYNVCYSGWDLSTNPSGVLVGIHHPQGDVKKRSLSSNVNVVNDFFYVDWYDGTVENGSSGSPLFDFNNKRIVGHLKGGVSANEVCDEDFTAAYGRFAVSWQNGNFQNILDEYLTGQTSVNAYCPNGSTSGGGYDPDFCPTSIQFTVNGHEDLHVDVCIGENINLAALTEDDCTLGRFPLQTKWKEANRLSGDCDDLENEGVFGGSCFYSILKCICRYEQLFIEVQLVDGNLDPYGSGAGKWMNFQPDDMSTQNVYEPDLSSFDLRDFLPSPYITFVSGQIYRIKVASGTYNGGWQEDVKYIHFYSDQLDIDGGNPTADLYGADITIANTTIDDPIDVYASNSLSLRSATFLTRGRYYIDEAWSCGIPTSGLIAQGGGSNNNFRVNKPPSSYNQSETLLSDQDLSKNLEENINIFPNPSNGELNVNINSSYEGLIEFELINMLGHSILKENGVSSNFSLDLSTYSKGIYLLKIKVDDNLSVHKIIYK